MGPAGVSIASPQWNPETWLFQLLQFFPKSTMFWPRIAFHFIFNTVFSPGTSWNNIENMDQHLSFQNSMSWIQNNIINPCGRLQFRRASPFYQYPRDTWLGNPDSHLFSVEYPHHGCLNGNFCWVLRSILSFRALNVCIMGQLTRVSHGGNTQVVKLLSKSHGVVSL